MPSAKKNRRQKMQHVSSNKKRMRRNQKRQKSANITCKVIKDAWDKEKTTKQNLQDMGIAFDPNKVLPVPRKHPAPKLIVDEMPLKSVLKPEVVQGMEIEAARGGKEKLHQLPSNDVQFCTFMMEKYGEDYKAMCKDRKNVYQLTPKQIRNKIREFKRCKVQYQTYIDSKRKTANDIPEEVDMETAESSR